MSKETTTITITKSQREELDNAAESLFGTTSVAVRATVERLLMDHPEVDYNSGD